MSISSKTVKGRKLYEVYVNGFDLQGRRVQRRKRSIENIRKAEEIEFQFERELATLREEGSPHTWQEWLNIAVSRMKRDFAASTVINYKCILGKWVNPHWKNRELKTISREDVYKVVFDSFDSSFSPNYRRTLLKQVKRIFEMAVEDGLLNKNPASGVKVHVPEIEQAVLTNEEVKTFLQKAKVIGIWICYQMLPAC